MQLPWQKLQPATIRAIIKDLGLSALTSHLNRHKLVEVLQDVETDGLDAVMRQLEEINDSPSPSRAVSPEIMFQPTLRPVVEITSPPKAGPSRIRKAVYTGGLSQITSTNTLRVGPPRTKKKHKRRTIAPPSYAILHQLKQEIKLPSKKPYPLLRPHERFDGVHLPALRRARLRSSRHAANEVGSPAGPRMHGASSRDARDGVRAGPPKGPARARKSMLLEGVIVTTSVRAVKSQWRQDSNDDVEMRE